MKKKTTLHAAAHGGTSGKYPVSSLEERVKQVSLQVAPRFWQAWRFEGGWRNRFKIKEVVNKGVPCRCG